jgi:tetratricopeptide (TPR) repeat protein
MPIQRVSPLSAEELVKLGRVDEARTAYREILERDADNILVVEALYRLERRCGNDSAACGHLRAAAQLDSNNLRLLTDLAAMLRELNRPEEAMAVYRQILTLDERHVASHLGLGWIARARRDDPGAIGHFRAAREYLQPAAAADPDNKQIQAQLATALRELGCLDEAAAIYRRILAADAGHSPSHEGLGRIAQKRFDHEAALAHFKAAAESNSSDFAAQLNVAKLLVTMDRIAEAKSIYSHLMGQMPKGARVRAALGGLARIWQDWAGALQHFQAALESDPANVEVRMAFGHTCFDLAKWDEAEKIFRDILEDSPHHIEAMMGLAETAKARGDAGSALALFERVAAMAPLDYRPKNAIRRLKTTQGCYEWRTEIDEAIAIARSPDAAAAAQVEAARTLVQYGLTEIAAPLLSRLEAHSAAARQLGLALRQIVRMGLAQPMVAGAAHPDPADNQLESLQGFLEKPSPGSDTLLLVFPGTNNRMWMTFSLMHKMLRKTGVSIVYARDLQHDWYSSGVVGLGEDFESTVEGFRNLAGRYGARRILTLGNCIGCLGALRFGLSLGAEGVLGFGPKLQPRRNLKPDQQTSLRTFRAKRRASHQHVRARYLAAAERPNVTLFFGEHCSDDAAYVRAMTEVPGAIVTAIPGSSDPDSLKDLLILGLLEPVLRDFVANGTIAPAIHRRIAGSANLGSTA